MQRGRSLIRKQVAVRSFERNIGLRPDLRMVKDVVTGYTVRWHEHVSPTNHLLNAASFKDPALLRKALAAGADPNHVTGYHQATPLHELARVSPPTFGKRTSAECIAILVEAGADPNSRDRYDETPLQKYLRLHGQFPRWYENSLEIVQAFILGVLTLMRRAGIRRFYIWP